MRPRRWIRGAPTATWGTVSSCVTLLPGRFHRAGFGEVVYHLGMSVVSQRVGPPSGQRLLDELLSTVRIVPASAWEAHAVELDWQGGLSPDLRDSLLAARFAGREKDPRSDLKGKPELIPYPGVLGGESGFHDQSQIVVLPASPKTDALRPAAG